MKQLYINCNYIFQDSLLEATTEWNGTHITIITSFMKFLVAMTRRDQPRMTHLLQILKVKVTKTLTMTLTELSGTKGLQR